MKTTLIALLAAAAISVSAPALAEQGGGQPGAQNNGMQDRGNVARNRDMDHRMTGRNAANRDRDFDRMRSGSRDFDRRYGNNHWWHGRTARRDYDHGTHWYSRGSHMGSRSENMSPGPRTGTMGQQGMQH